MKRQILLGQGVYYIATGLWPLFSLRSFERLTGPKVDKWLVEMVGLLAATIGCSLIIGARETEKIDRGTSLLAIASALSFAGIDIFHASRHRISPIYLADAAVELGIVGLIALN